MYKIFDELKYLNNYKTILSNNVSKTKSISLHYLPADVYIITQDILKRLNIISKIISGLNSNLFYSQSEKIFLYSDEELDNIDNFFNIREELYPETDYFFHKIDLSINELTFTIKEYKEYLPYLKSIYPKYSYFFQTTEEEINKFLEKMNLLIFIEQPSEVEYIWPNTWFITPHGYLYNSDGLNGHKEANMMYSYSKILELIKQDKTIPTLNYYDKQEEIKKRNYITTEEFKTYANLIYALPKATILEKHSLLKTNQARSYQPNLIKLVIGYLDAKTCFYSAFSKLNNSSNKQQHLDVIRNLTQNNIEDILVRFCGFSKIETSITHTITTSSIKGIEEFQDYLDSGWTLQMIPPIVYDKYIDKISSSDFNSYFIQKYFDKVLTNYKGKGKIIIKK